MPALLSTIVPGLGQFARGARAQGVAIFLACATALITTLWYAQPVWFVFPVIIWLWNIWHAASFRTSQSSPATSQTPINQSIAIPFAAWLIMALGIGVQVTEFDLGALVRNADRAGVILRPMLRPDFFGEGFMLSTQGGYVMRGLGETLGMALLATTVGAFMAIPFGFLAARNLMNANAIARAIYFAARTVLNITRSIESLIMAIIFVKVVGLGPFAGFIALAIHTAAALAKLFSEVIEAIDPGPIEAIRGTGATWLQTVRYAVIPQVVPQFTALTIYRWDINVRSSTIIGLVGGGGIGFFLYQWIRNGDYRAVSASFIAIAVVVVLMDFLSARIRARLN